MTGQKENEKREAITNEDLYAALYEIYNEVKQIRNDLTAIGTNQLHLHNKIESMHK